MNDASYTQKRQEHRPSGFCYTVVSEVEAYDTPPVVYCGEDVVDKFLDLLLEEKHIKNILKHDAPMSISDVEEHFSKHHSLSHLLGRVRNRSGQGPLSPDRKI